MKNLQRYILFVLLALCWGCANSDQSSGEVGYLSISGIESDLTVNSVASKADGAEYSYTVDIIDSGQSVVESYSSDDLPDKITLAAGEYSVLAYTGESIGAQFDAPTYSGTSEVTISPGEVAQCSVVCTLSTIKLSVSFSEDIASAGFDSYSVTVRNGSGDELTFTDETEGQSGYIVADGYLSTTIYMSATTNGVQENYSQIKEYDSLVAADYLQLTYDLGDKDDIYATNGSVTISVDQSVNEDQESYLLVLDNGAPTISGVDFDINDVLSLRYGNVSTLEFEITSGTNIENLIITHNDQTLIDLGLPKYINFLTMDSSVSTALSDLGVSCSGIGTTSVKLTLSSITSKLPLMEDLVGSMGIEAVGTKATSYKRFEYTVVDAVLRTMDATVSSSYIWNSEGLGRTSATLNGKWLSTDRPDGLSFKYRESDATTWIDIPEESLIFDESNDQVSYTFTESLRLGQTYSYKLVTDSEDGGEITFTSVAGPTVYNMSFDDWYSDGDTWYPSSSSSTQYWMTGNEGLTSFFVGEDSNSTPESSHIISGKAAKLVSVNGITMVKFAAGNLFTGTYSTNMTSPKESVTFGRSYSGRPSRLKGYYDYTSTSINTGSYDSTAEALYATYGGTADKCHIYISLEDSSGNVIGYGELKSDETTGGYRAFSIDIEYSSTDLPTNITMVATSSYLGSDFVGGSGSTLYVDEFEFEFD